MPPLSIADAITERSEESRRLLWPFREPARVGRAEPDRPELWSGLDMEMALLAGRAFSTELQALCLTCWHWSGVSSHSLGKQLGNIEYYAQPSSLLLGIPFALIHYPSRMLLLG